MLPPRLTVFYFTVSHRGSISEREPAPFFTDTTAAATQAGPAQTASQPAHLAPAGFERFWQAYPRKADKRAALLAWKALQPSETLVNAMLAALAAQCESAPWKESGGRYIPHPAKWLSHRRWEDATPTAQAPAKSYSMQPWAQQTSRPFDPATAVDILARHRPRRLKRLEACPGPAPMQQKSEAQTRFAFVSLKTGGFPLS